MFQREINPERMKCPDCGGKLSLERDLLHCKEHGAFFAYGPELLVRAPHQGSKPSEVQLPWENPRAARV